MSTAEEIIISERASLSAGELAEVLALKGVCDAHEGLDLKLGYGASASTDPAEASHSPIFLAHADQRLVGFGSLDGDATNAELCGMVHPDWRRRRLGFRLFEAARASFRRRGGEQLFAVCEDNSASGRAMLRMLAAQRAFSEHRMLWRGMAEDESAATPLPVTDQSAQSGAFTVARAQADEVQPLAAALARAFDQGEERLLADLASASELATEQVYVARLDGVIIGGFRLSIAPDATGIYAFGVDRAYQRQGLGRRMLARACALATEQGAQRVTLEVDTDNAPAIALYRSSDFEIITTYGYYIFSRTLLALGLDGGDDES